MEKKNDTPEKILSVEKSRKMKNSALQELRDFGNQLQMAEGSSMILCDFCEILWGWLMNEMVCQLRFLI